MIYSLLCIIIGLFVLVYTLRAKDKNDNFWDKVMTLRGVLGGLLFIIIGIVTLINGW